MNTSKPQAVVHHYVHQLMKYSHKLKKRSGVEDIHHFRVNAKKLRSFLRMARLKAMEPGELKYPHRLKHMYAMAGATRDNQLFLEKTRHTFRSVTSKKRQAIRDEIKDMKPIKKNIMSDHDFKEMEKNIVDHLPRVTNALIKEFIYQKRDYIAAIVIKGTYIDNELHDIRKALKDIGYIVNICREDLAVSTRFAFCGEREMKKTEEIIDTIGRFNDARVALSFVPSSEISKIKTSEKQVWVTLRNKWLGEKRKLRKEILAAIPSVRMIRPALPQSIEMLKEESYGEEQKTERKG